MELLNKFGDGYSQWSDQEHHMSKVVDAIDPWKLIISESIYNLEILKREMLKLSFWNTLYVGWIYMNSAKYTCFISKQVRLTWIFQRIRKNIGNRVTEIL